MRFTTRRSRLLIRRPWKMYEFFEYQLLILRLGLLHVCNRISENLHVTTDFKKDPQINSAALFQQSGPFWRGNNWIRLKINRKFRIWTRQSRWPAKAIFWKSDTWSAADAVVWPK
jgi:hypothetical protein